MERQWLMCLNNCELNGFSCTLHSHRACIPVQLCGSAAANQCRPPLESLHSQLPVPLLMSGPALPQHPTELCCWPLTNTPAMQRYSMWWFIRGSPNMHEVLWWCMMVLLPLMRQSKDSLWPNNLLVQLTILNTDFSQCFQYNKKSKGF